MQRSYRYKLRMNGAFQIACESALEACRTLYNCALEQRISNYKQGRFIGFYEQSKDLTEAREMPDVGSVLRSFQVNTLKSLDKAYVAFFRRLKSRNGNAGFPRFKGIDRFNSFGSLESRRFKLEGDKLKVQKLGTCRVRLSRPLLGRPRALTIRREADGWYVIIACDEVPERLLAVSGEQVGVDVGLEKFAVLSNGDAISNPRYFQNGQAALAAAQQRLALKTKGSESRKRAKRLAAKAYAKTTRQREWFQWRVARDLIARFGLIAVEKLNVQGMTKNHNLAKSIHDAGWTSFIERLACKAEEAGRELVKVDARYTSQDCSNCGRREKKELSERWHSCPCGLELSRDHNAAINILGRAVPSLKTELAIAGT